MKSIGQEGYADGSGSSPPPQPPPPVISSLATTGTATLDNELMNKARESMSELPVKKQLALLTLIQAQEALVRLEQP